MSIEHGAARSYRWLVLEINRTEARSRDDAVSRPLPFYIDDVHRDGFSAKVRLHFVDESKKKLIIYLLLVDSLNNVVDYDNFGTNLMSFIGSGFPYQEHLLIDETADYLEVRAGDYFGAIE